MNKWIKKGLAVIMTSIMVTGLVACSGESGKGSNNSSSETSDSSSKVLGDVTAETDISGATIEIAYNKADTAEDFFALVGTWADANGVTIQETSYGEEHEAQMKTRMGSGDLPDIWMTHGWSINRYGEYLMDLSDQPWVVDIDPGLKDVITTDDGELYILPITQSIASVTYNADVLEEAGVDPSEIRTWDDFSEALAAIKDKTDASPLAISLDETGFDSYTLELILPSLYTNADCADNKADKFLDGTFDFAKDLHPDIIGDVRELKRFVKKDIFDCIICCQVLEHLEFKYFDKIIKSFSDIIKKEGVVIISLPQRRGWLKYYINIAWLEFKHTFTIPLFWRGKFKFNGEHYWEISAPGYSRKLILTHLEKYFNIEKTFIPWEFPYHWFCILKPRL